MAEIKNEDKPYECNICNRRFTISNHLARHRRTHTKEKPYGCNVCTKRFTRSDDLRKHQRSHSGEKPYECFVCHRRFSQSSNLSRHKLTHIGDELYDYVICNNIIVSNRPESDARINEEVVAESERSPSPEFLWHLLPRCLLGLCKKGENMQREGGGG